MTRFSSSVLASSFLLSALVTGVSPARANTGAPAPQPQTVNNGQASGSGTSGDYSPNGQDQQKSGICGNADGSTFDVNSPREGSSGSGKGERSQANGGCNSLSNWAQANPEAKASLEAAIRGGDQTQISKALSGSSSEVQSFVLANPSQALSVLTGGAKADAKISDVGKVLFAPSSVDNRITKIDAPTIPVGQQLLPHLPVGQRSWVVQEADCNGVVTTTSLVDGNTAWNFGLGLPFASIGGGRSKPESIEIQAKERKLMRLKAYSATFGSIDRTGASQTTKSHIAKTAAIFGDESPEKVAAASEIEFTDGRSACQSVPPKGNTPPPSVVVKPELTKLCLATSGRGGKTVYSTIFVASTLGLKLGDRYQNGLVTRVEDCNVQF